MIVEVYVGVESVAGGADLEEKSANYNGYGGGFYTRFVFGASFTP